MYEDSSGTTQPHDPHRTITIHMSYGGVGVSEIRSLQRERAAAYGDQLSHNRLPVTLEWRDLNVFVTARKSLLEHVFSVCKKKPKKNKSLDDYARDGDDVSGNKATTTSDGQLQVLKNVSGVVNPGNLLVILGTSGEFFLERDHT